MAALDQLVDNGCEPGSLVDKLDEALQFLQQLMAEKPYSATLDLPVALIEEVIEEITEYMEEAE
jgi:hypothetical protein